MEFRSITQIIVVMKLSLIHFLFYYRQNDQMVQIAVK